MAASLQASSGISQKAFSRSSSVNVRSVRIALPRRSLALKATDNKWNSGLGRDANAAVDDTTKDVSQKIQDTFEDLQVQWERNDEKPTTVALILAAFVALWATGGLLDSIDRLPIIGGLFELVGLGVSGWFVYRYLGTAEDRKELQSEFDSFLNKVGVKK